MEDCPANLSSCCSTCGFRFNRDHRGCTQLSVLGAEKVNETAKKDSEKQGKVVKMRDRCRTLADRPDERRGRMADPELPATTILSANY